MPALFYSLRTTYTVRLVFWLREDVDLRTGGAHPLGAAPWGEEGKRRGDVEEVWEVRARWVLLPGGLEGRGKNWGNGILLAVDLM